MKYDNWPTGVQNWSWLLSDRSSFGHLVQPDDDRHVGAINHAVPAVRAGGDLLDHGQANAPGGQPLRDLEDVFGAQRQADSTAIGPLAEILIDGDDHRLQHVAPLAPSGD